MIASRLLKAGMVARVDLPTGTRNRKPLISKDALVLGGPKPVVYVVDVDPERKTHGVVREVPVQLGVADGGLIQVNAVLTEGQFVVVRGNERLRPGQKVTLTKILPSEEDQPAGGVPENRTEVGGS